MVTVPGASPVTIPLVIPIVAIDGLLLVHVPPGVALLSVVVVQIEVEPVIGDTGLTVKVITSVHPAGVV